MEITKIESKTFKTNEIAIFLTVPLTKSTITMNALIPAVLRRGSNKLKSQTEMGKKLENMYGANFNCGIDKTGNYCVLKFYIEIVNEKFLPEKTNIMQEGINLLTDIIFNPLIENGGFNKEYVKQEKENLKKIILSRKDNKATYAYNRCIEEMFKDDPYGIFKYGYIEDLEKINEHNLLEQYKKVIQTSKIKMLVIGMDLDKIEKLNEKIKLNIEKSNQELADNFNSNITHISVQGDEKIIKEKLDVNQGKLMVGLKTPEENKFAVTMYNVILGGGANSKLFQNVREKAGLAYSASSSYLRRKNAIIIKTGIELNNFDKTLNIIKQQLEAIKNGEITQKELESAKRLVISSMKLIKESEEDTIAFYFDQELYEENKNIEQYCNEIEKITIEDVVKVAKAVSINTIYFLEK